jgi:ribosomal protein S18 acetylase RimI-like enzyme
VASASDVTEEDVAALGEPRPLEPSDLPRATRSIARAFAWHEPWGAWAMPDETGREDRLHALIDADVRERFLPHGECWTIGGACTTLWIPPVGPPGTEMFQSRRGEAEYASYGDRADAMRAGDALIRELKPGQPHWYLDTIATDPSLFGRGLAGRLLAHDLAIRDAAGDVCALDTHTPRQVAFYERHGFEIVGEGPLSPELAVVMMVRPPGGGSGR